MAEKKVELETHADRKAADLDEPAEYAAHQEPPQNADAVGKPWATRIAEAKKRNGGEAGRRSSSRKKAPGSKKAPSSRKPRAPRKK